MAGREKNCKWYFADQPNGQEVGPNNAMEQNFKGHPYTSLVRESIQNSLDAVLDANEPVKVSFDYRILEGADFPMFFELKEHIEGCLKYYSNNPNAKVIYEPMLSYFEGFSKYFQQIGYIRVSDYNTKGMEYEIDKTDCPFYAFVRSAGVSAKDNESAGGSFGFGKAAYFMLSPVSTIMVSTQTPDGKNYFEGVSSLCTHTYNGIKKVAVGFYDDNDGLPISETIDIPKPLRRKDNEPGTNINILGFNLNDWKTAKKEMLVATLQNFWYAILDNKLVVSIDGEDINCSNIGNYMETMYEEITDSHRTLFQLNPRPFYNSVSNAESKDNFYLFNGRTQHLGEVKFYAVKDKRANDKILFMRSPKMVVFQRRNYNKRGMYGVFICDDKKGNEVLRNMENPRHDEWKSRNWVVNGRICQDGVDALAEMDEFIESCISQMFDLGNKTALNIKGLEEFLYIPTAYEDDEELDRESNIGDPTGTLKEDGTSPTTDIDEEDEKQPSIVKPSQTTSTGHMMINRTTNASSDNDGKLRTGHGEKKKRINAPGIRKPGDVKEHHRENESGVKGIYAEPKSVNYRTFSQEESGVIYHYVLIHSEEDLNNIRLHFAGQNEGELIIESTDRGNVSGNMIRDLVVKPGKTTIKVKFADDRRHAIILTAEEIHEQEN